MPEPAVSAGSAARPPSTPPLSAHTLHSPGMPSGAIDILQKSPARPAAVHRTTSLPAAGFSVHAGPRTAAGSMSAQSSARSSPVTTSGEHSPSTRPRLSRCPNCSVRFLPATSPVEGFCCRDCQTMVMYARTCAADAVAVARAAAAAHLPTVERRPAAHTGTGAAKRTGVPALPMGAHAGGPAAALPPHKSTGTGAVTART